MKSNVHSAFFIAFFVPCSGARATSRHVDVCRFSHGHLHTLSTSGALLILLTLHFFIFASLVFMIGEKKNILTQLDQSHSRNWYRSCFCLIFIPCKRQTEALNKFLSSFFFKCSRKEYSDLIKNQPTKQVKRLLPCEIVYDVLTIQMFWDFFYCDFQ